MVWQVRYTKTFYKELAKVPESSRQIIEAFVFSTSVQENPFGAGKLEKLVGSDDYYKARFGLYRVGMKIDNKSRTIEFMRVRHRRDIYRKFP